MTRSIRSEARRKVSQAVGWEFEAIGTTWWLRIFEPVSRPVLHRLQRAVSARIAQFDQTYSRFRDDSLVAAIARQPGTYVFPADSRPLFALYRQLYEVTHGLVTPLIGSVLAAAGYDKTYSLQPGRLLPPPTWDEALAVTGRKLTARQAVQLDFGAAGKGYLVDVVAGLLRQAGLRHFCVDASGDLMVSGDRLMRVGLEHPDDPRQVIGVATLSDRALCGSAGNRRAWGAYHHIMHPRTLQAVQDVKAVWVVADDALTADGLATALFFVQPQALCTFNFEYVVIDANNRLAHSPNFPAELFGEGGCVDAASGRRYS